MTTRFEVVFPSIPHHKIIDLITKRVIGVSEITKYCMDKEKAKEIIMSAKYISIYSKKKLLRQLNLEHWSVK